MDHISYSYCVGGNIVRMTTLARKAWEQLTARYVSVSPGHSSEYHGSSHPTMLQTSQLCPTFGD